MCGYGKWKATIQNALFPFSILYNEDKFII